MKTLKGKITYVYIFLVFIIAAIGISSVINLFNLGKSINGLINENYKSINAISYMNKALEDQNIALLSYITTGDKTSSDAYYENGSIFYKWYNVEADNITETGESPLVSYVNKYYLKYQSLFSDIKRIKDADGSDAAFRYYNNSVSPALSKVRTELSKIKSLNENAMFRKKAGVTASAKKSMYIIMVLSVFAIMIGFIIASLLTNKFLMPLYVLKENIKLVREGHIKQEVPIISNDEIGDLTNEFNKMIVRLQIFESGTKGKLLEERNKSMAIVKSISDPLIVLDTNFKVLLMNHACEMFFNISEDNTINKHFLEAIRENDIFDHIEKVYRSTADKHVPKIITVDSEGKNFYFDTIVTKIRNEEDTIIGLVVLFQNVTKLKKLEKAKTEFVSTISHEFKTPLTSIMMGTSLIKNEGLGKLGDKQIEIIKTIEDDTERLSTLVNDLIQLSKIESDRALYHFEPCSIFGIVESCIKTFTEQVSIKEINLYSEVDEKLPKIMADYEKISWVINNLISNAIKYTNAGDYISVHAKVKGKNMQISVKDTGMGIPDEYKERIFDKFVKVTSYHTETSGTGLGLSIAKEIVTVHKGTIWCDSELDEGSIFTFTVPLADQ